MPLDWNRVKLLFQASHVLPSWSTTREIPALIEYSRLISSYAQRVREPYVRSFSFNPFLVRQ